MTANICFARMLAEGVLYTRVDTLNRGVLAADETLGHEAKSGVTFALKLRFTEAEFRRDGCIGNYAECQHCGSVFIAEDQAE